MTDPVLIGIDGCPAGWYAVRQSTTGGDVTAKVYAAFDAVLAEAPPAAIIAVDIPIGLLSRGSRPCDELARAMLAPSRGSSVFPAPLRAVLTASTHADASAARRSIDGKGMSIQAFAITRKVREVDVALERFPQWAASVHEVHPEVCFTHANGGRPMALAKKKAAGRAERMTILSRHFGDAPTRLVQERTRSQVGADDVLDALIALWTAQRIARGEHASLPAVPASDERGRRMAIHY